MTKRNLQIGVMGSMADTKLGMSERKVAIELGKEIAKIEATLVFGYEGDFDSFSTMAAKSAEKHGGITIAFLWGNKGVKLKGLNSIRIETGQLRGGGREFPLVISCDGIICIGGGSGTLTEMLIAYQKNIPIVVIEGTGGWSDKLAGKFLDNRKRAKVISAKSPKKAMRKLLGAIKASKT